MTHEEKLAAARMYYRDKRDYCKRHHFCYACMQKIDEGGTQTHCSVCRARRNWLARERRKTWSPERIAKKRTAQKKWRFEHPEKVEAANRRNSALRAQRRREARDGNQACDQKMSGTTASTAPKQAGYVRGSVGRVQGSGGVAQYAARTSPNRDTRPAGSAGLRYQSITIKED